MLAISYDNNTIIVGNEEEVRTYQAIISPIQTLWLFTPESDEFWIYLREYHRRLQFKI